MKLLTIKQHRAINKKTKERKRLNRLKNIDCDPLRLQEWEDMLKARVLDIMNLYNDKQC